jgi:TolA-binding protein
MSLRRTALWSLALALLSAGGFRLGAQEEAPVMELPELVIVSNRFEPIRRIAEAPIPVPADLELSQAPSPTEKELLSPIAMEVPDPLPELPRARGCGLTAMLGLGRSKLVRGARQVAAGRLDRAARLLERFIDSGPPPDQMAEAAYWLARCRRAAGQETEALEILEDALKLASSKSPIRPYLLLEMAALQIELGRSSDAAETAQRLLDEHGDSECADAGLLRLAQATALAKDYSAAAGLFHQAAADPTLGEFRGTALFWEAESRYAAGDYRGALKGYREFVQQYPGHPRVPDARYGQAWSRVAEGRYDDAVRTLADLATREDAAPLLANIYYLQGRLEMVQGHHEAALRKLEQVLLLPGAAPWREVIAATRVWLHYRRGAYEEAVRAAEEYARVWGRTPRLRAVELVRATAMLHLDRCGEAITILQRLAGEDAAGFSYRDFCLLEIGVCMLIDGDAAAAEVAFREVLERFPGSTYYAEALYWLGESELRLGRPRQARERFQRIVREFPDHPKAADAAIRGAWALYMEGDWQGAYEEFSRLLRVTRDRAPREEIELAIGDTHYNMKQFEQALAMYRGVAESASGVDVAFEARQRMAAVYQRLERFAEAEKVLQPLLEAEDPAVREQAYFQRALASFQQGRYEESRRRFAEFARLFRSSSRAPDALLKIADSWYNLGRIDEAEEAYARVIARHPGSSAARDAQFGLAFCYLQRRKIDGYLRRIDELVQADPRSSYNRQILTYAADALLEQGRCDKAAALYRRVMREFPAAERDPSVLLSLARCLLETGALGEVRTLLEPRLGLLEGGPAGPEALSLLARAALQAGDSAAAERWFDRLLGLPGPSPFQEDALYMKAKLALDAGRMEDAAAGFARLLRAYPEGRHAARARVDHAAAAAALGRCDRVKEDFERLLADGAEDLAAEVRYRLGECLQRQGDEEGALSAFMAILYLHPESGEWPARAALEAGRITEAAGRPEEALRIYRKAAATAGDTPAAAELQRRIAALERPDSASTDRR